MHKDLDPVLARMMTTVRLYEGDPEARSRHTASRFSFAWLKRSGGRSIRGGRLGENRSRNLAVRRWRSFLANDAVYNVILQHHMASITEAVKAAGGSYTAYKYSDQFVRDQEAAELERQREAARAAERAAAAAAAAAERAAAQRQDEAERQPAFVAAARARAYREKQAAAARARTESERTNRWYNNDATLGRAPTYDAKAKAKRRNRRWAKRHPKALRARREAEAARDGSWRPAGSADAWVPVPVAARKGRRRKKQPWYVDDSRAPVLDGRERATENTKKNKARRRAARKAKAAAKAAADAARQAKLDRVENVARRSLEGSLPKAAAAKAAGGGGGGSSSSATKAADDTTGAAHVREVHGSLAYVCPKPLKTATRRHKCRQNEGRGGKPKKGVQGSRLGRPATAPAGRRGWR